MKTIENREMDYILIATIGLYFIMLIFQVIKAMS